MCLFVQLSFKIRIHALIFDHLVKPNQVQIVRDVHDRQKVNETDVFLQLPLHKIIILKVKYSTMEIRDDVVERLRSLPITCLQTARELTIQELMSSGKATIIGTLRT
jgi:hypothetical protein